MTRELPPIIEDLWYSIDWDVPTLWALDLPKTMLPMERLIWHLDVPVWPDPDDVPYRVTPRQVIENPSLHAREIARVDAADLAFPIEVILRGDDWMILDGIHRLTKAWRDGATEISARIVPDDAVRHL